MSDSQLSGPGLMKFMKEMKQLTTAPPEGTQVHFSEDNISTLLFDLTGPVDTPFEGGLFRIKLQLPSDYPNSPPKGWFLTKIFHPNVNFKTGEICVSTLKKDWSKTLGLKHVLVVIRCLLIEPNPESALNEDAGKLLLEAYADYFARAKMMTKVHAKPSATATVTDTTASSGSSMEVSPSILTPSPTNIQPSSPNKSPSPMMVDISQAKEVANATVIAEPITAIVGEEENKNTSNVAQPNANIGANTIVKKPLSASAVINAGTTATAAVPLMKQQSVGNAAAKSAAEEKAKLLKKKSLKRL